MPEFKGTFSSLELAVAYSSMEGWLFWTCVLRRNGEVVDSFGGSASTEESRSDRTVVEEGVTGTLRSKFPKG